MTTPPPAETLAIDPGWTPAWIADRPNGYGRCWTRYVPGKGIAKVTSARGGGYDWHLTVTGTEAIAWSPGRYSSPRAAKRAADRFTAHMPPRLFAAITSPDAAARLYMTLERGRDLGYSPGAGDWDLGRLRGELLTHIRTLALHPTYHGPSPDQVAREAVLWRAAAARTGLRDSDFDPVLLGADGWERNHLRAAAVFALEGDYSHASGGLDLAMTVSPAGSAAADRIGRLKTRLGVTAGELRAEDPPGARMSGITTRRLRQELLQRGFRPATIEALIETVPHTEGRQDSAGNSDFTLTAVVSDVGPGRWDLLTGPYAAGQDTLASSRALAALTAGKAIPVVNRDTGQYALVTGRSAQGGIAEVRNPEGSQDRVAASSLVPAVTVLDAGMDTAVNLARDLGIAPPAGPGRLRYGSPSTAWYAIVRANGLHAGKPAVEAAGVAASMATGFDPANANWPHNSVPWARAACQALHGELSPPVDPARPSSARAARPNRRRGGLPPDPVDFPGKVAVAAPGTGLAGGGLSPATHTRRLTSSKAGRTT